MPNGTLAGGHIIFIVITFSIVWSGWLRYVIVFSSTPDWRTDNQITTLIRQTGTSSFEVLFFLLQDLQTSMSLKSSCYNTYRFFFLESFLLVWTRFASSCWNDVKFVLYKIGTSDLPFLNWCLWSVIYCKIFSHGVYLR